jgi:hypothetical protein
MSRRGRIVYAHPADEDGYAFFYLYYWPGDRILSLRYRRAEGDIKEVSLPPAAMLDLIENQAAVRTAASTELRPWVRVAKVLRLRIKTWMERATETG